MQRRIIHYSRVITYEDANPIRQSRNHFQNVSKETWKFERLVVFKKFLFNHSEYKGVSENFFIRVVKKIRG